MDGVGEEGAEGAGQGEAGEVGEGGAEPLGEGADVGAEEGVDGVGEHVVGREPAVGEGRQGEPRAHGVHQVGPRPRHSRPFPQERQKERVVGNEGFAGDLASLPEKILTAILYPLVVSAQPPKKKEKNNKKGET